MLREIIKNATGRDLPISGGSGMAYDDPVIVDVTDAMLAARVEMEVVHALSSKLGLYWNTVHKEAARGLHGDVEKLDYEVKRVEGEQVIIETRTVYFDVSKAVSPSGKTPIPMIYLGDRAGLSLPYEIGWVHYTGMIDNEVENPGLGVSVSYDGPQMRGTLFVYDKEMVALDIRQNPEPVHQEFNAATEDMARIYGDARVIRDISKPGILANVYAVGDAISVLQLTTVAGRFMLFRLTLEPPLEQHNFACLQQSLSFFEAMVGA